LEVESMTDDGDRRLSEDAQDLGVHPREVGSNLGASDVPKNPKSCLYRILWAGLAIALGVGCLVVLIARLDRATDPSEPLNASGTESTSTTSPVGPGESTATLDASRCDTADEVAVEAWQFTEGEVFYGVGEDYDYWFLCLYGDGVAGRIRPIWDKAIGNTYVITGDTYRFESNWPTLFEPLGTEYLSTRVFEMTRTGDVLEGEVVWIGWELASVYDDKGSATPEWVAIEHEPETLTVRAVLLPRSS
jgi:hypothetical protein